MVDSKLLSALQAVADNLIVSRGSDAYAEITKSYFSELERELEPACYVTPRSTKEVTEVVKILREHAGDLKIAICGAGQQATPGVANVQDGLTIHLHELLGVTIGLEKNVVSVAAGERMGNVYEKLISQGLGVAGNRHSRGGIGGDAVQGGLSYYSYSRGFICDDVVNYEVVLANGDIVNANAQSNSDLFTASKGGGNNFGIVTRFDLQTFNQGHVWGGKDFYPEQMFSQQVLSLVAFLHSPQPDTDVHICLKYLEPFASIESQIEQMCTLRTGNLKSFTDEAYAGAAANRVVKMTTTVRADAAILEFAVEEFKAALSKLTDMENILFSLTFEPIPVSMIEQSNKRGKNATGLKPSDGPLVVILLYTSWDQAQETERVYAVNKMALSNIQNEADGTGTAANYRYLNYAFPGQDVFSSYGEAAKDQLLKVQEKYNPHRFFQNVGVSHFKLG